MRTILLPLWAFIMTGSIGIAQNANYDEAKVPDYELPNLLMTARGAKVTSAAQWHAEQRDHVFDLVESQVYGKRPSEAPRMSVVAVSNQIVDGMKRKQVTLRLTRREQSIDLHLLMFLPTNADGPVPTFLGLNFMGNHTTTDQQGVPITQNWVRNDQRRGYENHRANEQSRGSSSSRWPFHAIVERGYGAATIYYGDIDPDEHDEFKNGIHALYPDEDRQPSSWGSISAWAWGLSFALDYFEQDNDVNHEQVAVMGHSRLGKTSLWAGATDKRFALVISNNSGCGGAALSRRRFGETVKRINTSFPHWFCDNYKKYNDHEDHCPVDQHALIALIAPRPVLICSAQEDRWADPKGEFLSGLGANGVYRLLGTDGMAAKEWPGPNDPVLSRIGYHLRPGGHDVKMEDWKIYMDFADKHFGRK